jgi:hypothetical protein
MIFLSNRSRVASVEERPKTFAEPNFEQATYVKNFPLLNQYPLLLDRP